MGLDLTCLGRKSFHICKEYRLWIPPDRFGAGSSESKGGLDVEHQLGQTVRRQHAASDRSP